MNENSHSHIGSMFPKGLLKTVSLWYSIYLTNYSTTNHAHRLLRSVQDDQAVIFGISGKTHCRRRLRSTRLLVDAYISLAVLLFSIVVLVAQPTSRTRNEINSSHRGYARLNVSKTYFSKFKMLFSVAFNVVNVVVSTVVHVVFSVVVFSVDGSCSNVVFSVVHVVVVVVVVLVVDHRLNYFGQPPSYFLPRPPPSHRPLPPSPPRQDTSFEVCFFNVFYR